MNELIPVKGENNSSISYYIRRVHSKITSRIELGRYLSEPVRIKSAQPDRLLGSKKKMCNFFEWTLTDFGRYVTDPTPPILTAMIKYTE